MLQQTTVAAVVPYFTKFVRLWPSVDRLASAARDDVLAEWAGLGYYSRARNLHKCAGEVMALHQGEFPSTEEALLKLPGIGPYTAAAIAAIAFARPANVVDGNVERVMARFFAIETPMPTAKAEIKKTAGELVPVTRNGDYAQALMDLGATICTPKSPKCMLCPIAELCAAHNAGQSERYPVKAPKKDKPTRFGTAYLAVKPDGSVLLRQRPDQGLLGAMMEVPSSDWIERSERQENDRPCPPFKAPWQALDGTVRHTFTHFHLELAVQYAQVKKEPKSQIFSGIWVAPEDLGTQALPTVMKKIIRLGAEQDVVEAEV